MSRTNELSCQSTVGLVETLLLWSAHSGTFPFASRMTIPAGHQYILVVSYDSNENECTLTQILRTRAISS